MTTKNKIDIYKTFDDIYEAILNNNSKITNKQTAVYQNLLKGIADYGFTEPTPIQSKSIIPLHKGVDMIAQSQSGTGKTGAFSIGLLSRINPEHNYPQGIVLATTRELATQIHTVISKISKHMKVKICLSIGGDYISVDKNINDASKSHIIVGTPGRISNLIYAKAFNIHKIKTFILDEADALLSNDFIEQIRKIIIELSKRTQICVYSATFNKETLQYASKFLDKPVKISLEEEKLSLDVIQQYKVCLEHEKYKIPTLIDLYKKISITQSVIFVNTVTRAKYVFNALENEGHEIGLLHGKMTCQERLDVLEKFRNGEIRVLISTDIIARGIDIQQIGLVFNYDIPKEKEVYLHRIGRSGRYGRIGVAINFIITYERRNSRYPKDTEKIENITNYYKNIIDYLPDPEEINKILLGEIKINVKKIMKAGDE